MPWPYEIEIPRAGSLGAQMNMHLQRGLPGGLTPATVPAGAVPLFVAAPPPATPIAPPAGQAASDSGFTPFKLADRVGMTPRVSPSVGGGLSHEQLLQMMQGIASTPMPAAPDLGQPQRSESYSGPSRRILFPRTNLGMYGRDGSYHSPDIEWEKAQSGVPPTSASSSTGSNAGPAAGIYSAQTEAQSRGQNALMNAILGLASETGINGMPGAGFGRAAAGLGSIFGGIGELERSRLAGLNRVMGEAARQGRSQSQAIQDWLSSQQLLGRSQ